MLDGLAPLTHGLRVFVETPLYRFEQVLMLPTTDAAFLAGSAAGLDGAALASRCPVAVQDPSGFFSSETIGQALTGRADVDVLVGDVAEILLSEPALRLGHSTSPASAK